MHTVAGERGHNVHEEGVIHMPRKLQILVALSALALATAASAADVKSGSATAAKPAAKKPSFESSATATATSTVDSVDVKKRTVTFHTPDGDLETVAVGDKVKNLDQVKPGDTLTIRYRETTRVKVFPAGAELPEAEEGTGSSSAAQGEMPSGAQASRVTMTATVEKLDKKTGKVRLKGQDGKTRNITAKNKDNLKNVEVGDQVVLTREKAVAVSVKPPPS
jgi:hypothetical protein